MNFKIGVNSPQLAKPFKVSGFDAHLLDNGHARLDIRGEKGWIPSCSSAMDFKEIALEGTPAEFELLIDTIQRALRVKVERKEKP